MENPSDCSASSHTPTHTPIPTSTPIPIDPCPAGPASLPLQSKKHVSMVWTYFTKLEDGDSNNPQTKNMADGSNGGATLKEYTKYDPDECRRHLARMVIMDELPFQFVEGKGFQAYSKYLEPRFNLFSRHTVAKDIKKQYMSKKELLRGQLVGQMVCLTTDTWTSIQNFNYISLTAHFVDCDWTLHKKILKFCQISDHKGETIGRALEAAIKEWRLARVVTITVDNASSNDVALGHLKTYLREAKKTIMGGECLHVRCVAQILNLIVIDGLKDFDDSIARVRTAVRFVKSSPARLDKFKVAVRSAGITSKKSLCTDVPTRWNTTFLMLEAAQEYQLAFTLLGDEDIQYVRYFDEHGGLGKPIDDDWEVVTTFVEFFRLFYEVTTKLSGSLYPTSPHFCQQICKIKEELDYMCASDHIRMREMALMIRVKYNKYLGDFSMSNILLYVAVVLDPQFKIVGMVYGLGISHGNAWAELIAARVKETLLRLFDEFTIFRCGNILTRTPTAPPPLEAGVEKKRRLDWGERLEHNPIVRHSTKAQSEVDRYLAADLQPFARDFDILAWWKSHAVKYPVLGEIARNILAIPISTVASESAFSTGGHILDPFRSSLSATTVEALICTQNWIKGTPIHIPDVLDFQEADEEEGGD